ncbi:hypothetical protein [Candidatus Ruminimicrobiellum ovillum]|uniref:hypothetical protein n=1 Tax=Candidatus Ruminimicrobiellum ovillum TaxID=1947927 RepID=UPI00355A6446
MYKKFILLLVIGLFITGCVGIPKKIDTSTLVLSDTAYNKKLFDSKNKSLIILSCESSGDLSYMNNVSIAIKGVDNPMPETFFSTNILYPMDIMLSPGVYEISKFQIYNIETYGSNSVVTTTKRYLNINNIKPFSKIEVQPGELLYIGDFVITTTKLGEKSSLYDASVSVGQMPEKLKPFIEEYEKITNKKVIFRIVEDKEGESK